MHTGSARVVLQRRRAAGSGHALAWLSSLSEQQASVMCALAPAQTKKAKWRKHSKSDTLVPAKSKIDLHGM